MRTPAEVYQPSARRLDERIKSRLYDAGGQTRRVSEAGFIAWEGKTCYVGESFGGVEVALEVDDVRILLCPGERPCCIYLSFWKKDLAGLMGALRPLREIRFPGLGLFGSTFALPHCSFAA